MAQTNNLGLVIYIGLALIVGTILASAIGDYSYDATTISNRINESITIASTTATLSNDDVTSITALRNGTHDDFSWLISTIGFNYTEAGVINANDSLPTGTAYAAYNFQGDGYVDHATSRVFLKLIPLFFAIAVLGLAIFMGIKQAKELGWL